MDGSMNGFLQSQDDIDECRFSPTGSAEDGEEVSLVYFQRDALFVEPQYPSDGRVFDYH
jgi:hypothetical protein